MIFCVFNSSQKVFNEFWVSKATRNIFTKCMYDQNCILHIWKSWCYPKLHPSHRLSWLSCSVNIECYAYSRIQGTFANQNKKLLKRFIWFENMLYLRTDWIKIWRIIFLMDVSKMNLMTEIIPVMSQAAKKSMIFEFAKWYQIGRIIFFIEFCIFYTF